MLRTISHPLLLLTTLAAAVAACSGEAPTDAPVDAASSAATDQAGEAAAAAVIKERRANFETIGKTFKTLRGELEKDSPDFALIAASASDINARAMKIEGHFPPGTSTEDGLKTEALPAIWAKPEAFRAAATKLVDESARLAGLAPAGDKAAVSSQMMAMGGACKGCHDQFRLDDKK